MAGLTRAQRLERIVEEASSVANPLDRALLITDLMAEVQAAEENLRSARRDAVVEMHDEWGMSFADIGEAIGVNKARAIQIYHDRKTTSRKGVIAVRLEVEAARMRGAGATDAAIARSLIPVARAQRGGENLTVEAIAEMLGVEADWLAPRLAKFDAKNT